MNYYSFLRKQTAIDFSSNLDATNGDVNIANVVDTHQEESQTHKSKTTVTSVAAGAVRNTFLVASTAVTAIQPLKNPNDKTATYQENEAAMKDTAKKSETNISQITDETVIASNLNFANDLNISSGSGYKPPSSADATAIPLNRGNKPPSSADATAIPLNRGNKPPSTADATAIPLNRGNINATPSFPNGNSLPLNKGNIIITSSNLSAGSNGTGNLNINSANGTIINNAVENDSNFTLLEKKSPNIFSAFSNGFVQLVSASMPDFTPWEAKKDSKEGKAKSQRENDSLGHEAHRIDFDNDNFCGNFCAFFPNHFPSKTFNNFKNSPSSAQNASSLLFASLQDDSRRGLWSSAPKPVLAKNAVRVFLTPKPTFESELRQGTLTLSAGVGNMAVDTAYAEYDLYKAIKDLADAKKNLNHIETLHKSGKADSDAVSDAKTNLIMATANVALADLKLAAAAAKTAESAKTLGFYADLTLTRTGQKTNTNSSNAQEVGSNILAKNNILINSGANLSGVLGAGSPCLGGASLCQQTMGVDNQGNTNIKGSIASTDGSINIISAGDTNITALKSTSSSATKSEGFTQTITLASSAAGTAKIFDQLINNLSASIGAGVNKSKSDSSSTAYDNTQLTAANGEIKINSRDDTTIKGANLLAENLTLNTGDNLSSEVLLPIPLMDRLDRIPSTEET